MSAAWVRLNSHQSKTMHQKAQEYAAADFKRTTHDESRSSSHQYRFVLGNANGGAS